MKYEDSKNSKPLKNLAETHQNKEETPQLNRVFKDTEYPKKNLQNITPQLNEVYRNTKTPQKLNRSFKNSETP